MNYNLNYLTQINAMAIVTITTNSGSFKILLEPGVLGRSEMDSITHETSPLGFSRRYDGLNSPIGRKQLWFRFWTFEKPSEKWERLRFRFENQDFPLSVAVRESHSDTIQAINRTEITMVNSISKKKPLKYVGWRLNLTLDRLTRVKNVRELHKIEGYNTPETLKFEPN